MTPTCSFCGEEVDPDSTLTWRKVHGWEHYRAAGGTNALALREPQDEWACWTCIDRERKGIPAGQGSLIA